MKFTHRSLISKCIESDEVGKAFSILAVIAALVPVASNPLYRQLYDSTMDSFPGAIFLLTAALYLAAAIGNLLLYFQRDELINSECNNNVRRIKDEAADTNKRLLKN
jgi:hypothetical protein